MSSDGCDCHQATRCADERSNGGHVGVAVRVAFESVMQFDGWRCTHQPKEQRGSRSRRAFPLRRVWSMPRRGSGDCQGHLEMREGSIATSRQQIDRLRQDSMFWQRGQDRIGRAPEPNERAESGTATPNHRSALRPHPTRERNTVAEVERHASVGPCYRSRAAPAPWVGFRLFTRLEDP